MIATVTHIVWELIVHHWGLLVASLGFVGAVAVAAALMGSAAAYDVNEHSD